MDQINRNLFSYAIYEVASDGTATEFTAEEYYRIVAFEFTEDASQALAVNVTLTYDLSSASPMDNPTLGIVGEDFTYIDKYAFINKDTLVSPLFQFYIAGSDGGLRLVMTGIVAGVAPHFGEDGEITMEVRFDDSVSNNPSVNADLNSSYVWGPNTSALSIIEHLAQKRGAQVWLDNGVKDFVQDITFANGYVRPRGVSTKGALEEFLDQMGLTYDTQGNQINIHGQYQNGVDIVALLEYRPVNPTLGYGVLLSFDPNFDAPSVNALQVAGVDKDGNPLEVDSPVNFRNPKPVNKIAVQHLLKGDLADPEKIGQSPPPPPPPPGFP
jgi:hypothetical protein